MDDAQRKEVELAVVVGLIGVVGLLAQLWISKPGTRMWFGAAANRVMTWRAADPYEGAVRQFRAEVSRWDHEQAAQKDHRAGG
jgi:hypothetical protein